MRQLTLVLLCVLLCGCRSGNKNNPLVLTDPMAKEIIGGDHRLAVYDFDGLEPLLHQEDGQTYIINFWATWCAPCIKELPHFERINSAYPKEQLRVILVSLDMPTMWQTHLLPFIERKNLKSQIVILDDPKQNTWIPKVDAAWSGGIPATLIYNNANRKFYEQAFTYEALKEEVDTFLKIK